MLRKTWYAVLSSQDLSSAPIKVTVHEMDFILWRDGSGKPHAFNAYCPHRGCDLSLGTVKNDELICPFHGWRFNERGNCTHIPANPIGSQIPSKARLCAYPARDEAELTWIYTSPVSQIEAVPVLKNFAELVSSGWIYVPFKTVWRAHFSRVVESVLDVSHLPFVHPETAGADVNPIVKGPDYSVSENGIVIHPTPFVPSHPMEPINPPEGIEKRTEIELIFPNQWIIRTPMGDEGWMCTFLTFTPVDSETTNIFGIAMRNFEPNSPFLDTFHLDHTHFVMNQDKEIVEHVHPNCAPSLSSEVHVPSDGPTIRFRTLLFESLQIEALDK